jgi:hypothetical protein
MRTRTFVSITIFVVVGAIIFIFAACDNGGGVSNTITFTASTPGISKGEIDYGEATDVFTFDADGVLQSFEMEAKWEIGASAEGMRVLETVTAWTSGTGLLEQIAALKSERQFFELANFDDPIPAFDTNSPDYETTIHTFTWSGGLLQEITDTQDSIVVDKDVYDYNPDDTLKAMRSSNDGGLTFGEAFWYQYGDPNFPLLPIEERQFWGTDIPSNYDYANDPDTYKTGPTEESDRRFTYTPNADDQLAELVQEEGDGWTPSWTNYSRTVCSYDSSGRVSRYDIYAWSGTAWTLYFRFDVTYSGSVPSFSLEELYFSMYYDYMFIAE